MSEAEAHNPTSLTRGRILALAGLLLLAIAAGYRAWIDIATIALEDPEQSQVLLALPAFAALLWIRRSRLDGLPIKSSFFGLALAGVGWLLSWFGYLQAMQSLWHFGALMMAVGAAWSVVGDRRMLVALPALIALIALVPVPNLLRQDIALPLQRMTAAGAEFVMVALGFGVKRVGLTLFYHDKPVTIEEACNGMRMVFALVLVSYSFAMSLRLNTFARLMLLGVSPLLAVLCNIIRVVPTVAIYGVAGDGAGDTFHDISGWGMIVLSAFMLLGLIRLLDWADVPIYADAEIPVRVPFSKPERRRIPPLAMPAVLGALMVVAAMHSISMPSAADAAPYHRTVAHAERDTPVRVEGLEARALELPEGSLKLLRPNAARAVQYTDTYSGTTGQFLLIQSKDARDLSGHYPPRCYPNVFGYIELKREDRVWEIDGVTIRGTQYTFAESGLVGAPRWVVLHFFALPGGETTGELADMRVAAADYLRRHRGAAQIQMLFRESQASPRQRDKMFKSVMVAHADLMHAILEGPAD